MLVFLGASENSSWASTVRVDPDGGILKRGQLHPTIGPVHPAPTIRQSDRLKPTTPCITRLRVCYRHRSPFACVFLLGRFYVGGHSLVQDKLLY